MASIPDLRSQWVRPGNILDILLLVGADVVRVALAQLSGSRYPTPVVFSFGWVAYAFSALVSIIGDKHLMPTSPLQSIVINVESGYVRDNQSWLLGRLLRDFEDGYWMDDQIKTKFRDMLNPPAEPQRDQTKQAKEPRIKAGLCISVYEADPDHPAGERKPGLLFWMGYVVAVAQLAISAIPWIVWGGHNYMPFFVTLSGTFLAFVTASLPQWRKEQFACRKKTKNNFILTRGNGAQHALVILGEHHGLNLEDLASSSQHQHASLFTRAVICSFTILWVVLLITVDGLETNTWFLVIVGGLGSIYTSVAAGVPRSPQNLGFPLKWTEKCIVHEKVMIALIEAEQYRSGLGLAMLDTFFPGSRSAAEEEFWRAAKELNDLVDPPSDHSEVREKALSTAKLLRVEIRERKQTKT